jgi:hypothetical protein
VNEQRKTKVSLRYLRSFGNLPIAPPPQAVGYNNYSSS